jgi:anti-sigma-K factor RskA
VDIKEYISSGIVESYVLGLASSEERAEFEALCGQFPELVAARNDFEIAVEARLLGLAVIPAHEVKEKVMSNIRQQSSRNQTKVITMEKSTNSSSSSLKWVAAASIILLLVAGYFAYDLNNKNKKLQSELAASKGTVDSTAQENAKMDEALQSMVSDPNVAVVSLKGTEKAPKSTANIYWDSTSANVYLVVKNMPKLPSEKQYQLWSIINGQDGQLQPTSLGLFDVGEDGKIILKTDTGAKKADAFAITIENRGNTGGPNLGELQVMGKTIL